MKAKNALAVCLMIGLAASANAQEYDDMYFNSSDRATWKASRSEVLATSESKKKFESDAEAEWNNPTDSYSARNVNPEYVSREKTMSAQEDEKDYFVENYAYNQATQYNSWNNSFNDWYTNPWYSSGFYGSSFNRWSSPFQYGYYDPFYDPMFGGGAFYDPWGYRYSPYSYGMSSSWGWGMGLGMSYTWGNPYYGSYCPWNSYGYGSRWYGGGNVVIINNGYVNGGYENARPVSTEKRPSRSTSYDDPVRPSRSRDAVATYPTWSRSDAGGRSTGVSGSNLDRTTRQQDSYYNKNWRGASQGTPTRSSTNRAWSDWDSNGSRSSGTTPSRTYDAGRSSSPSPSYSPAPSSGSRSSGSGSSGRTRGRE